jgi:hypothetical protein
LVGELGTSDVPFSMLESFPSIANDLGNFFFGTTEEKKNRNKKEMKEKKLFKQVYNHKELV